MNGWYILLGISLVTLFSTIYVVFFSKSENKK